MKFRALMNFSYTVEDRRFPLVAGEEFSVPAWFEPIAEAWIQAGLAERIATDDTETDGQEIP